MQILITGGAGFIGSSLADKLLQEGHKIIVIDNFNEDYDVNLKKHNIIHNLDNKNYKLYQGDICDNVILNKIFEENCIDVIVHIAAKTGVRPSIEASLNYIHNNVTGTVSILEQMKKHNIKKLIFASSSSVYGNCADKHFSETSRVAEPISPYAASKLACEQFIYTYSKLFNISAICLRFFTVYGPRQRPDLAIRKFIELIENGESIPIYGDGTSLRDYTYIDDIIAGICSSINYSDTKYEIINLANGNPIQLNDMISTIELVLNKKAKRLYLDKMLGDVDKTSGDITKAKKLLSYNPQTSFKDGIIKFIEWRNNHNE